MKTLNHRFTLFSLLFLLLSLIQPSCKGENRDADIQTAIASKTATDAHLAGVSATVENGVVTLIGQCEDEACRDNAEKTVKKIEGVKKVVNNITVTPAVVITPDNELRDKTKNIVSKYKNVRADVNNGIITLRGEVKHNQLQQLMMDLNALRPKRIDNQLIVK
jgi:osmotically-inducible protein OsmY